MFGRGTILFFLCSIFLFASSAWAEQSFRCKGSHLVQIGDSRHSILNACGKPDEEYKDELVYNLGQNSFIYSLRFEGDRLKFIENKGRGFWRPEPKDDDKEEKGPYLKNVDMVKLSAGVDDGVLKISPLYKNRETDTLIFWESGRAVFQCTVYENDGNSLDPIKGEEIGRIYKAVNRFGQSFYMDIPPEHLGEHIWGIIECQVNTGYKLLNETEDFLIR